MSARDSFSPCRPAGSPGGSRRYISRPRLVRIQESSDDDRLRHELHEPRVELGPRILLKFLDHSRQAEGASVRAIGRHSVNCVGNHDYARADRNLLPSDTVGISRPVEVFVMVPDHRLNRAPQLRCCRDELRTSDHVRPHDDALFWRQPAVLAKEWCELLIDLANIMQKSRPFDAIELISRELQFSSERKCVCSDPPRVT